jgi:hypothetical protein
MTENLEKYVELGRQRLAAAKAADEAKAAADKAERREINRLAWMEHLQFVYAVLPEDLHVAVSYDADMEPTYYNGGSYHSRPVSLNCDECAPIQVELDGYGRHPRFVSLRVNTIAWFEGTPYINYSTGAAYEDPLMAIAEAYSLGPAYTEAAENLAAMESAIAADPDLADRLHSVFAQSLSDLPASAPPDPLPPVSSLVKTFFQELHEEAIAPEPEPEPTPNKTTELIETAHLMYENGQAQLAMAAALIAIAELLADDRPLPF